MYKPIFKIPAINGWIFIDKPRGLSSFAVVSIIKKMLPKGYKIGHGGTLDPQAEGLLPIALGEATKTVQFVMNKPKQYTFTLSFGLQTTTADIEGQYTIYNSHMPSYQDIKNILPQFTGKIIQIPPLYSAVKINGTRAYKLANKGKKFDMKPRKVRVYELNLISYNEITMKATFSALVGKGTYIRSLGVDIALALNACAYISYLRRESFKTSELLLVANLNKLCTINEYYDNVVHNIEDMLDDISAYPVNFMQAKDIKNGITKNLLSGGNIKEGLVKAIYNNKIIAILNYNGSIFKIIRGFNHFNIEGD